MCLVEVDLVAEFLVTGTNRNKPSVRQINVLLGIPHALLFYNTKQTDLDVPEPVTSIKEATRLTVKTNTRIFSIKLSAAYGCKEVILRSLWILERNRSQKFYS